jgi:hypothetical protein
MRVLKMKTSSELNTIPYWDEEDDDDDDTPAGVGIPQAAPVAGKCNHGQIPLCLSDEVGQFDFPCCFAERL